MVPWLMQRSSVCLPRAYTSSTVKPRLDAATIEDAGLVEVDMRLDQARGHQASAGLQLRTLGRKIRRDGDNGLALDGDVGVDKIATSQDAGITNDLIHHFTAAGTAPR
jgi:hypothetical protein